MARYFTSDWHLNSTDIIKYAHRPFKDGLENISTLISNCNRMTSKSDTVVHVGDFCLSSVDRHGEHPDIPVTPKSESQFLTEVNANFVLLAGNHDEPLDATTMGKCMFIDLNQTYRNVSVSHYPTYMIPGCKIYDGKEPHIHLCGHCHDKWLIDFDMKHNALNINVGCDCWNFCPVKDSEITALLDRMNRGITNANPIMTRQEFEEWVKEDDKAYDAKRAKHKEERYQKRGLTPEECERRKYEAMKVKGLVA